MPFPTSRLLTPVQFLRGVGPERAEMLHRLGLKTAADVLFHFPRTYQDLSDVRLISDLEAGEVATVVGVVEEIDERTTSTGKRRISILIRDKTDAMRCVWFDQPFMKNKFQRGSMVSMAGKPKLSGLRWEMVHPRIQQIDSAATGESSQAAQPAATGGEILPVYSLTEGWKQSHMRRLVRQTVDDCVSEVNEVLPNSFRADHQLLSVEQALRQIHNPATDDQLTAARRRFIFQELFVLQLALSLRRRQSVSLSNAEPLIATAQIDSRIRRLFPFELTAAQNAAIEDVKRDLAKSVPMNRLLQGDVGSGKTVVAIYAMLVAVAHGYQAALMAPTEVLARQHNQTLKKALVKARTRIELWTGSLSASERRETIEKIRTGEADLIVGTQAVLNSESSFANLRVVVIDEQHKFGVQQRASLRDAGIAPHYLVMTATPIPRTVALTAYGDLDHSQIDEYPPGRGSVNSYLIPEDKRADWWEFFRKQLRSGRQGYVVTPRLAESDSDDVTSLVESFEALCNGELEAFRLDLIHGRMPAEDKNLAMAAFREGKTQVLVATSVIEVGIDVRNAAVMTIQNAERFGLAQLHQMRGRVGRGKHAGYVGLFVGNVDADRLDRLESFVKTTDGFKIAELDFANRGPGDMLGIRQHGLPPFRIANLVRDESVLREARQAAQAIVESTEYRSDEFADLRRQVVNRYGERFELGDVG